MRSSYLFYLRCLASLAMLAVIPAVLASDYTLEIFGNANMDDKIDEADVTHIEAIIASSTSPTPLSDANGDGEVDGSDIDQVQRIINGIMEQ
ncbi:MAG: iron complex transport system substrate-binding protein, partial [Euryarchaeota archaeon]|nr:iron complex transport system substrate-binding protein [Euryarchaeota archaeon]